MIYVCNFSPFFKYVIDYKHASDITLLITNEKDVQVLALYGYRPKNDKFLVLEVLACLLFSDILYSSRSVVVVRHTVCKYGGTTTRPFYFWGVLSDNNYLKEYGVYRKMVRINLQYKIHEII
jgi:hypothetical protein